MYAAVIRVKEVFELKEKQFQLFVVKLNEDLSTCEPYILCKSKNR